MEIESIDDVIYLDFAKAFDIVDHGILMKKFINILVGGCMLNWLHNFLAYLKILTILGQISFLFFVADINEDLSFCHAASFADDTRVVCKIESQNDFNILQNDLNKIYTWAKVNNMQFNGAKFEHLRYGTSDNGLKELFTSCYMSPELECIKVSSDVKDLGVILSSSANFETHVETRAKKGKILAGWIFRTFATRDVEPMLVIYKSLLLPILEYSCQVWTPTKLGLIRTLEAVQRNFTGKLSQLRLLGEIGEIVFFGEA